MSEPLIKDCACGQDHMTMPTDTDWDENGNPITYDLVCVEHKRHLPCRKCLWRESGASTTEEYLEWLRR